MTDAGSGTNPPPRRSAAAVALGGNTLLAAGKGVAGVAAGSQALVADALHSVGDVLSTLASVIGSKIGGVPPDADHPFGHGGAENFAALVVSLVLFGTGYELLEGAAASFFAGGASSPGLAAAAAAAVACLVKEAMYRHAYAEARATASPATLALARDHRSDVLSSLAALGGVLGARAVHPLCDPAASLLIAGLIFKMAWETLTENVHALMLGEPPVDDLKRALRECVARDPEMVNLGKIRVMALGADLHLELDLRVRPEMTVREAHAVAHRLEAEARRLEPRVVAAQVHVEPAGDPALYRDVPPPAGPPPGNLQGAPPPG